jgi:hypothetical protein
MTEDKLDREIDLALQEMVAGDGPADLRRRVLERVAEPPRRVASRGVMLAVAATIALAAATGVVLRRPIIHPPATITVHRDVPRAASPLSPPPAPAGSPTPARSARLAVRPAPRQAALRREPAPLTATAADAELAEMDPIELSPLAVPPMTSEHVTVGALRIERLQIEPLAEAQP